MDGGKGGRPNYDTVWQRGDGGPVRHIKWTAPNSSLLEKEFCLPSSPRLTYIFMKINLSVRSNWKGQPITQTCWESATYNQVTNNGKPFNHNRRLVFDKGRVKKIGGAIQTKLSQIVEKVHNFLDPPWNVDLISLHPLWPLLKPYLKHIKLIHGYYFLLLP